MNLIAHRANDKHEFSENSLKAIKYCLATSYIKGVEIDIRMTKDKRFVLIHDPIIDFLSTGIGIVSKMNLFELKKYKYGKTYEELTTLEEVLQIYPKDKILMLEIKYLGNDYKILVEELLKVLDKYKYLDIYISSFNYDLIKYLKDNTTYKAGLLILHNINRKYIFDSFDFKVINVLNTKHFKEDDDTFIVSVKKMEITNEKWYYLTDNSYKYLS